MNGFTAGITCGAILGAGIALALNPVSKRDMRKMRCCANKMLRRAGRIYRAF